MSGRWCRLDGEMGVINEEQGKGKNCLYCG